MTFQTNPEAISLDQVKTLVDILGTIVTAIAVVVAGVWAYFNFVKGRTYRPRLEISLSGKWHAGSGTNWFHLVISVKNMGGSA